MNASRTSNKNRKQMYLIILLLFLMLSYPGCKKCPTCPGNPYIVVPDDIDNIQQAIDSLPEKGGTVYIKAGEYVLSEGIHINRSDVTITGEKGTLIKLGDRVNQPVFLLGSDEEIPEVGIGNVQIKNLEIDGNKSNQTSEVDPDRIWIRNNGMDVRMANKLWISEVEIYNARSGGIVISWNSEDIFIDKSSFHNNFFDGIALYASEDIQVTNFSCYENEAAGLSLDNQVENVIFSDGMVKDNLKPGIFARDSKDLSFNNLMIKNNGINDSINFEDGCFLSHNDQITGRASGVTRLFFNGCSFIDNKRNGIWLASSVEQSPDVSVVGCLFSGNGEESIKVHPDGELYQEANVFQ